MRKLLISLLLYFFSSCSFAQPGIQWQKCLGGMSFDYAYSIQQTADSGYIIAGSSNSNSGDVSGNHGDYDFWIVKLNSSGTMEWQKCLGGTSIDGSLSIQQTTDSGYIVAGISESYDGDVSGYHGGVDGDYWIVKLNSSGTIQWQKCLGGTGDDNAQSIEQTNDGGYIVAGYSESNDGDVSGNHGDYDCWVVKLNSSGAIQWQKCLGGTGYETAYSIHQTIDSGYIVAGYSDSNDGDVSGNHGGVSDSWIVKLNGSGTIQWQKCLGGSGEDEAWSIQQSTDTGYIVAGWTFSNDGDVSGNHGGADFWIVKLNSSGIIQWQKCLGGTDFDKAHSIQQTRDSGYVVAGFSHSNDGDVTGSHQVDYWVVKLNSSGTIQWQKCLGGAVTEDSYSIQQTTDMGYIVAGRSNSNDIDVSGNHGVYDYWIVKLNPDTITTEIEEITPPISNLQIIPNPISSNTIISFSLFESSNISVSVYDITGRLIRNLSQGLLNPGRHQIKLNVADELDDGVYLLNLSGEGFSQSCKLVVVK